MKLKIEIDTNTPAFEGDPRPEIARILRQLPPYVKGLLSEGVTGQRWYLYDRDGNVCGSVTANSEERS